MALQYSSGYCNFCDKTVKTERPGTNHILHLLLSIVTAGLWLIVWILTSVKFGGWRCSACGKMISGASSVNTFVLLVVIGLMMAVVYSAVH